MTYSAHHNPLPPYAGDVTANEAWEALKNIPDAKLIDVRTEAEWTQVGMPDISSLNKAVIKCSWKLLPDMRLNGAFESSVMAEVSDCAAPLYFLCKAGGRSMEAAIALTALGYTKCYNIIGGAEAKTPSGYTGLAINGWKASNLPWLNTQTQAPQ